MKKISYLKILVVVFMVLTLINFIPNYTHEVQKDSEKGLKKARAWDLTGSPIDIDDLIPTKDWSTTAADNEWCNGSGTWDDPYILENITIDGKDLTSCITIKNSDVYFRIENCIVFNSSSGYDNGGIRLDDSNNGTLIDNNCSNNNGNGIRLSSSQNVTISGNTANNNVEGGIWLSQSHNNNVSGNTLNENSNGVLLSVSNNNTISENSAFNNTLRGIYLTNDNINNTFINNNLSYNKDGISVSHSHNNTFIGNNAEHNDYGIWVWRSNYSIINRNNLSYNAYIGLRLSKSNNTVVIGNVFKANLLTNIQQSECENNIIKFNYISGPLFPPVIIDDDGGGDFTWSEAKALFSWCTGSGSYSDPYIIQNLIIDGQNSSSCIEIRDSNAYFRIENCTLYNSGLGIFNAGIELDHSYNGTLIGNNCSNNDSNGIFLTYSSNNTISGNLIENNCNNVGAGINIFNYCENNTISDNIIYNNGWYGIWFSSSSNNNTIMRNNVTYNSNSGIIMYSCDKTHISNNNVSYNNGSGI